MERKFIKKMNAPSVFIPSTPGVTNKDELEADIQRMIDYIKNQRRKSASDGTVATYTKNARTIFKLMGRIDYTRQFERDLKDTMRKNNLKNSTQISYLWALEALHKAVTGDYKYIVSKPAVEQDIKNDSSKYLKPAQIEQLFDSCNTSTLAGIRDKAILAVAYFGALRNAEICHLQLGDYDAVNKCIIIRSHGEWHPKNYQARKVFLPDACLKPLEIWLAARREVIGPIQESDWLFMTERNAQFSDATLYILVKHRGIDAGLPQLHPHQLRHSRATWLANYAPKPWPVAVISKFLGHSCIEITMRYVHVDDDQQLSWLRQNMDTEIRTE